MNLSEIKNEDALDLLADILEPCGEIFSDKELSAKFNAGEKPLKLIAHAIKNHKKEVLEIMARLDGVDVKEYQCNFMTLPIKIMNILNDTELMRFFDLQGQKMEEKFSGPATEITQAKGK